MNVALRKEGKYCGSERDLVPKLTDGDISYKNSAKTLYPCFFTNYSQMVIDLKEMHILQYVIIYAGDGKLQIFNDLLIYLLIIFIH